MPTRIEHDLLGERAVPADAMYGVHTLRATENFPISGVAIGRYAQLVDALASVKQAAALANGELGVLAPGKCAAIVLACETIRCGALHEHFVVDMIQGGAGTSTNMNANEVIANCALELMGHRRGQYQYLHPNEDVNQSQSTNDVYPTAIKLALHGAAVELAGALATLRAGLEAKAREFAAVVKMGRTQLQDAVPMTLGQEFAAFAAMIDDAEATLLASLPPLRIISLGATAIGTGITAPAGYASVVCRRLAEVTGMALSTAPDLVAATQDTDALVGLSSALKRAAIKLSKICSDLRLLSSGPMAGFGDIHLPAMQAGSSIMPGKVNPVMPEVVNQIAFEVIGNDVTVCLAAESGQLQLNAFEPIIVFSLFKSLAHLRAGCALLVSRCIDGISADPQQLRAKVMGSMALVTALNPYLGYTRATTIAREAQVTGRGIAELVLEHGWMSRTELDALLLPEALTQPPA